MARSGDRGRAPAPGGTSSLGSARTEGHPAARDRGDDGGAGHDRRRRLHVGERAARHARARARRAHGLRHRLSRAAAASSCPSAAAASSTSTSPTAPSCTWPRPGAGAVRRRHVASAQGRRTRCWHARRRADRRGAGGAGLARRPQRLARRAGMADRGPSDRRHPAVVLAGPASRCSRSSHAQPSAGRARRDAGMQAVPA